MTITCRGVLLIAICIACLIIPVRTVAAADTLRVDASAPPSVELGQPFRLSMSLANVGDTSLSLPRTYTSDGWPAELTVIISTPACEVTVVSNGVPHPGGDRYITLTPGERLELSLPPLNRDVLRQRIWSEPGAGTLRVRYDSNGSLKDDAQTTIAWSNPLVIQFESPDEATLTERRAALTTCLRTEAQCLREVAYFAAVRDAGAADVLAVELERRPDRFVVVRALTNQARRSDADLFERLAAAGKGDRTLLLEAAHELTHNSPCGSRESTTKN